MSLNKSIPIILIIDDVPIQHEKIKKAFPQYNFHSAFSIEQAEKKAKFNRYDLILLDLELSSEKDKNLKLEGIDLIPLLEDKAPIIVISSHDKSTIVSKTIRVGAFEFLSKKDFRLLEWSNKFDEIIYGSNLHIFFLHSEKDNLFLEKLIQHFMPLKESESIITWHTGELMGGDFSNERIKEEIDKSHIILPLLTSNFFSDNQTQELLNRCFHRLENNNNLKLIPILLSPCFWDLTKLNQLKPLPQNELFITTWNNEDEAYRNVVYSLSLIVKKLKKKLYIPT